MEENSEVVVFGSWFSGYCTRIELALKLKGIPYKYVHEDLDNKSQNLIEFNPAHKKVPVFVHNGKSIAESLVILEYIDEYWTQHPKLLPDDPYQRAKLRFWAHYFDQTLASAATSIQTSEGERQKKAIKEFANKLRVFEEGIVKDFGQKFQDVNDENLGFLDIVIGPIVCNSVAFWEAIGVDFFSIEKHPVISSWITALKGCNLFKETLPPYDKLVEKIRAKFEATPKFS